MSSKVIRYASWSFGFAIVCAVVAGTIAWISVPDRSQGYWKGLSATLEASLNNAAAQGMVDVAIDNKFPVAGLRRLEIVLNSFDIQIVPADVDAIELSVRGQIQKGFEPLIVHQEGDLLKLSIGVSKDGASYEPVTSSKWRFNVSDNSITADKESPVVVKVPRDWKPSEIRLRSISGDVELEGLSADTLILETVSGDIELDAVLSRSLKAETVSGDVEVEGVGSGDVQLTTTSGDLNLKVPAKTNASVELNTVSGGFTLNGEEQDTEVPGHNRTITLGTGHGSVAKLTTVSGNISVGSED